MFKEKKILLNGILKKLTSRETGISLLETTIALAVLGAITVTFLSGLITGSQAAFTADKRATAESLAQSQLEWVLSLNYTYNATSYSAAPIPDGKDYINYTVNITAAALNAPDDGIQKITVTVYRSTDIEEKLESYKLAR